jgi:hypothetical protein
VPKRLPGGEKCSQLKVSISYSMLARIEREVAARQQARPHSLTSRSEIVRQSLNLYFAPSPAPADAAWSDRRANPCNLPDRSYP